MNLISRYHQTHLSNLPINISFAFLTDELNDDVRVLGDKVLALGADGRGQVVADGVEDVLDLVDVGGVVQEGEHLGHGELAHGALVKVQLGKEGSE